MTEPKGYPGCRRESVESVPVRPSSTSVRARSAKAGSGTGGAPDDDGGPRWRLTGECYHCPANSANRRPPTRPPRSRPGGARPASLGTERVPERLGGVLGLPSGEVLDLLAAGDPRRDQDDVGAGRTHGGRQAPVAEPDRDVVVLALEAERPCHPAAARVHLRHLVARPPEGGDRGRRAHERLLVAVAVEQRLPVARREGEREPPTALALEELLEEETLGGHRPRRVGPEQVDVLVAQGEETRGLEPDDRDARLGPGVQALDVPGRVGARRAQHALRDQRPAAALLVDEPHPVAGRDRKSTRLNSSHLVIS